jgi:hypothetical protein
MYTAQVPQKRGLQVDFAGLFLSTGAKPSKEEPGIPSFYRLNSLTAYQMSHDNAHPLEQVGAALAVSDNWGLSGATYDLYRLTVGDWTKLSLQIDYKRGSDSGPPASAHLDLYRTGQVMVTGIPSRNGAAYAGNELQEDANAIARLGSFFLRPAVDPLDFTTIICFTTLLDDLPLKLTRYSFLAAGAQTYLGGEFRRLGFRATFYSSGSSEFRMRCFELQYENMARFVVWADGHIVINTPLKHGTRCTPDFMNTLLANIHNVVGAAAKLGHIFEKQSETDAPHFGSLRSRNQPKLKGRPLSSFKAGELSEMMKESGISLAVPPPGMTWRNHAKKLWMFVELCKNEGIPCGEDPQYFRPVEKRGPRNKKRKAEEMSVSASEIYGDEPAEAVPDGVLDAMPEEEGDYLADLTA